jgi:hypothetical protein
LGEDIDASVAALSVKLAGSKIPASTIVALSDLQECIKVKECNGLEKHYLELLDALLRNKQLDKKSLSQLYSLKASYFSEVLDRYDLAYEVLGEGVKVLPGDYNLRKSVLYYYVITADLDRAALELDRFQADFDDQKGTREIVREVCEILKERGFNSGCTKLQDL